MTNFSYHCSGSAACWTSSYCFVPLNSEPSVRWEHWEVYNIVTVPRADLILGLLLPAGASQVLQVIESLSTGIHIQIINNWQLYCPDARIGHVTHVKVGRLLLVIFLQLIQAQFCVVHSFLILKATVAKAHPYRGFQHDAPSESLRQEDGAKRDGQS